MRHIRLSVFPRPLLIALAVVITSAAGWSGWWWLAGRMLHQSLETWAVTEREQGGEVRFDTLALEGFPLRLRAVVTHPTVTRRDGFRWHGPEIIVEAPLWAVNSLHLRLSGRQDIVLPTGLDITSLSIEGGEGTVTVGGAAGFTEAHVALTGLRLLPTGSVSRPTTAARLDLTAILPRHPITEHTDTGLMVMLRVDTIQIPLAGDLPLGPSIESLSITARVLGAPPRVDPAALAAWSHDGGTVELDTASLHWGPLALGAEGTLALDRDLQPIGALTAEITGFTKAIDTLVAAGWVKAKQGQTAKAVLMGLSPHKDGTPPPLNPTARLPISLHDRYVHLGPFRLAPIPTVIWQKPAAG